MSHVVTITRPDVVKMIEDYAAAHTAGDETEAVAQALRRASVEAEKPAEEKPFTSAYGAHRGSAWVAPGVDLTEPVFEDEMDAETGREIDR